MPAQHSALTGSSLHEPKYIQTAATSDAGKVITPSASTAGTGDLRQLTLAEITAKSEPVVLHFPDIGTAGSIYFVAPFDGSITKAWSAIYGAIATTDTILTLKINTVSVTNGSITIAFTSSAAGDIDSCTPSALNTFSEGDLLEIASDGATSSTQSASVTLLLARN